MVSISIHVRPDRRFLKAADLQAEKKFRIKRVTEETVGVDKDKEQKLVVWFTNDKRGLVLNRLNNRIIRKALSAMPSLAGPARSSCCFDLGGFPRHA